MGQLARVWMLQPTKRSLYTLDCATMCNIEKNKGESLLGFLGRLVIGIVVVNDVICLGCILVSCVQLLLDGLTVDGALNPPAAGADFWGV